MNTSAEALKQLQAAIDANRAATRILNDLIVPHDYGDVALLVSQAAGKLLEAAAHLMENNDEAAFGALEDSDDLIDQVYGIMDAELDDEE